MFNSIDFTLLLIINVNWTKIEENRSKLVFGVLL